MTADQDPAWLAWRAQGIGASDVAAAFTGKYGGAYAVVAGKRGLVPPIEKTEQMERGHRWEQPIADAVHALTGLYVHGEQAWCTHPTADHHRCTADGFLSPLIEASIDDMSAVLEVKTTDVHVKPPWDYYEAQVQFQLHVLGFDRALLALATIDDTDDTLVSLKLAWIERDDLLIEQLAVVADELWTHVVDGTLPPPNTPESLEAVKAVHRDANPTLDAVDLSEFADDLARLDSIKAAVKQVSDEHDLIQARIRDCMGSATKGMAPGFKVSLSQPARILTSGGEAWLLEQRPDLGKTVLDKDRAKTETPDLLEKAREAIGARRLTISQPKRNP